MRKFVFIALAFLIVTAVLFLLVPFKKEDQVNTNEPAVPPSEDQTQQQNEKVSEQDSISKIVKEMSLEEKVGQMLMPDFRTWNGGNVTSMLPEIEQMVKDYHLGGVILFEENVVTTDQTTKLLSAYQQAADKYGLLLAIDQEGGVITRLQKGTNMPGNMAVGATRSSDISYRTSHAIGKELAALGFNMNLAPVLDVNNNPDNPVIGVRSFGGSPELVAEMGIAYTKGLQEAGVAATAKHFPGHGDTTIDSHLGLPEVPHDRQRLLDIELYPFQQAMEAGVDAVMTAHVTFPNIDDTTVISKKDGPEIALPATLSPKVLTGLMREEMGYQGVIITDALNMKAISDHFGPVDAALRAVKAGTDIVLMPVGLEAVAEGLYQAVETGEISEERINQSAERILTLKQNRGILEKEAPQPVEEKVTKAKKIVGSKEHQAIETEASEQSITLVKNEAGLPLDQKSEGKIAIVGGTYTGNLYEAVSAYRPDASFIETDGPLSEAQLASIRNAETVLVGTYSFLASDRDPESPQVQLVHQLMNELDATVIGVAFRNPYDIMAFPEIDGYLAQYGVNPESFQASSRVLFGDINPSGKLPVSIPDLQGDVLYEFGHGLDY